jgi:hypothetical protein
MTESNNLEDEVWSAKVWRVRAADGQNEVGPVNLDQVRRGLESGRLDTSAQLAREDSDKWLSARDIISAAITRDKALAAKPPPEPSPDPPPEVSTVEVSDPDQTIPEARMPAPSPKQPSLRSLVPLVLLSMAAVAGASFAAFHYLGPRAVSPTARTTLAVDRLPRWTVAVTEAPIRDDLEELSGPPRPYVAAWLAERACGGVDLAERLRDAQGGNLAEMHGLGVVDLSGQRAWLEALRCGDQVAEHLATPRHSTIAFEHESELQTVTSLQLDMDRMPDKADRVSHTYGGLPGFCQDETPQGEKHCSAKGPAGFNDRGRWFFGTHRAIDAFAADYTSSHRERSSNIDILAELSQHSHEASSNTWLVHPRTVPWQALCQRVAPRSNTAAFVRSCFPPTSRAVFESAETKIRGLAVERDELTARQRVRWSMVLLARSDDAARWIEGDLLDVRRDWQSHLVDKEPELIKLLRSPSERPHDRLWASGVEPLVRALEEIRVERKGRAVRFETKTELTPYEQKTVREFLETPQPEHDAMVSVLSALSKGDPAPVEPLARFLGSEVAAWAAAPRASLKDCQPLHAKFEALASDPSALELVELRARLSATYAPAACEGMVMSDAFRSCLLSAASLHAFAACEPPRSPYASEAHRRLRGQWSVANMDTRRAERWPYNARRMVRRCRLEVGEHRLAFDCMGETAAEALRIEADDLVDATLYVPFSRELHPKHISLGEKADEWVMTDFARGVRVTFQRDHFDESLLEAD